MAARASNGWATLALAIAACAADDPVGDAGGRDAGADACACAPCAECRPGAECVPDHSRCAAGETCDPRVGCVSGVLCTGDPPSCADDGDPCGVERCDTTRAPPRCVTDAVDEGTACELGGATGTCHGGRCCTGCWDSTRCHPVGDVAFCGAAGSMCRPCTDANPCTDSVCMPDGSCASANDDSNPCTGGACFGGACCTGCWNGSACVEGTTAESCGARGALCEACACPTPRCVGSSCTGAMPIAIAAGLHHTCTLTSEGLLYCWGMNDLGQLGASTAPSDHSLVPVLVSDDAGFTSLSLADNHAFALRGDELYGWGTNSYGELGFGDTLGRRVPTLLSSGWRAVSAGVDHTCAIRDTGALYCWGFGGQGQLGLGVIANYLEPQEVMPGTTFTAVAAFEHTCAITTGGALYCWGKNDAAQAGTPRATPEVLSPLRVGADTDWSAIAAGRRHTCGLRGTALYCFGENAEGQLGRGAPSAIADPVPALVAGDHRWAAVSLGAAHTIARTTGNELYGWGDAGEGELGIGAAPPASVGSPMRAGTATDWRLVEGGTSYSCGVRGGAVHCFGMNRQNPVGIGGGQLGLGDRIDRFEPAPVCLP